MPCIDLTITDQHSYVVETGVSPSLDNQCQNQIIFGKWNIVNPLPPPYRRTIWEYPKANVASVRYLLSRYNWYDCFHNLGCDEMVEKFYGILKSILYECVPNKVIKCSDKDPPWIPYEVKHAIKRKHRIYTNFVLRRRKVDDWSYLKEGQESTSIIC